MVTEALAALNVPYLLPLCLGSMPYSDGQATPGLPAYGTYLPTDAGVADPAQLRFQLELRLGFDKVRLAIHWHF